MVTLLDNYKKILLVFLLISGIYFNSFSQDFYKINFTNHPIIKADNNGFVFFSSYLPFKGDGVENKTNANLIIYKFDDNINVEWKQKVSLNKNTIPIDVASLNDNGYVLIAHYNYLSYPNADSLLIVKLDSIGNQEWIKVIDEGPGGVLAIDGGFILSSTYKSSTEVLKLSSWDTKGNVLWSKEYYHAIERGGSLGSSYSFKVEPLRNKKYGFLCRKYFDYSVKESGYIDSWYNNFKYVNLFLTINKYGDIIEEKQLNYSGNIFSVKILSDTSVVYLLNDTIATDEYLTFYKEVSDSIVMKVLICKQEGGIKDYSINYSRLNNLHIIGCNIKGKLNFYFINEKGDIIKKIDVGENNHEYNFHSTCKLRDDEKVLVYTLGISRNSKGVSFIKYFEIIHQ